MTYRILCAGRGFYFEAGAASRPIVVTRRGQPALQPSTRHPFWRAVALWNGQGRRMSADGLCVWDEARRSHGRPSAGAKAVLKHRSDARVSVAA